MMENALVFPNTDRSLSDIIDQANKNAVHLRAHDVNCIDAARAAQGEVWSPQLPAYKTWEATKDAPVGTDGDLLVVGALGMGIPDDERERLLARAVAQEESLTSVPNTACERVDLRDVIAVRKDVDGYAIAAFDLRKLAHSRGWNDNLVVVLPSFIEGVPVVRIAAEAFSRRFVQGVGVRVLVVPQTVRRIGARAFSTLAARHIHLGRNLEILGEQPCDLNGTSPRLTQRTFSVDEKNDRFLSRDGSLFAYDEVKRVQRAEWTKQSAREEREEQTDCASPAKPAEQEPCAGQTAAGLSTENVHTRHALRLLFLAPPYDERIELPREVSQVDVHAFAEGCTPPSVVVASDGLAQVDSKQWDDVVWMCPPNAPVYQTFLRRSVRVAGPAAIQVDACWYDVLDSRAVLVAGPPRPASVSRRFAEQAALYAQQGACADGSSAQVASPAQVAAQAAIEFAAAGNAASQVAETSDRVGEVLHLPLTVAGYPLERIGVRALPYAPASLVIPDSVTVIERDNACRETKRLVLSQNLQVIGAHSFCSRKLMGQVVVPASVVSIGEGCFEYAVCKLEHTGSVVHISADQLLSCFLEDAECSVPFDFERYDELLMAGKNLPDRLGALVHRLSDPVVADDAVRKALLQQVREQQQAAQQYVAREGDLAMVEALVQAGFITEQTFDRQIEYLRTCNRTDCVAYLIQWYHGQGGSSAHSASARDRFAL